jgi:hypothetical protein
MGNLFRAFFFKLKKDLTFRIALFIGIAMAVFTTLGFLLIDIIGWAGSDEPFKATFCSGNNLLVNTLNPAQNFGLVVPILLTVFTVAEYNNGIIRNKIIAGHSKFEIYGSLMLSGLILTFTLLTTYVGLCTLMGTIFGGFNLDDPTMSLTSITTLTAAGKLDYIYILEMLLFTVMVYTSITAFTIFFASIIRSVGPCIPIIIISLMVLSVGGTMIAAFGQLFESDVLIHVVKILDPLFAISGGGTVINEETLVTHFDEETLIWTVANNLGYSAAFFFGGAAIFSRSDIK